MTDKILKAIDEIDRPSIGETYYNRLTGLEVEVRAIARGHVICNAELTLTRDEFNHLYVPEL